MSEILLLNTRKRRKKSPKRRKKRSASQRSKRQRSAATTRKKSPRKVATKTIRRASMPRKRKRIKRRAAPKRNPSRGRRAGRAIAKRATSSIAGLNFRSAMSAIPISVVGMMASKWAAKRFGGATETNPASWTWASYLKGAAGAAGAGILANMLRRGWGQKILEGGMSLMLYKLIQNELVPKSSWAENQFGADERVPGVVEENEAGEPFILGEDYQWYPLMEGADDYRMPEMYGDALVEPGPLGFGDTLVEPGPLGVTEDYGRNFLTR